MIAWKGYSRKESEEDVPNEDENFMHVVKRLEKCFNNDKSLNFSKRKKFFRKKEASMSTQNFTCFECGK